MLLNISATADYDLPQETALLLMIEPRLEGTQHRVVQEALRTTATLHSELITDLYGNVLRRLVAPAGLFSFDFSAVVEAEPNAPVPEEAPEQLLQALPVDTLLYTLPSRYCPSDRLSRLAEGEFGHLPPGGVRVHAIAEWVRSRTEYRYGATDAMTAADAIVIQRSGVCRDFAHLTVSLCRGLGIPARYVSGYCLDLEPPDFHAWAQVWLGGSWQNVDATAAGVRPALVPIAHGRDAADVSLLTLSGVSIFRAQAVTVQRA